MQLEQPQGYQHVFEEIRETTLKARDLQELSLFMRNR